MEDIDLNRKLHNLRENLRTSDVNWFASLIAETRYISYSI